MRNLALTFVLINFVALSINAQKTGVFKDSRDGQKYKTIKIGNQVWMAENLNYDARVGSWCYDDKNKNCKKYGRLYEYEAAKNICPTGWHLPTVKEFGVLLDNFESVGDAYVALRSGGTSGFNGRFGGYRHSKPKYVGLGASSFFWAFKEKDNEQPHLYFNSGYWEAAISYTKIGDENPAFSVRCIQD